MGRAPDNATVVSDVEPGSPAARLGIRRGDRILTVNGTAPRDIIEWKQLAAEETVVFGLARDSQQFEATVEVRGERLGLSVESALFDRVHTCDNHCDFCFIYQLPKGLRRSLYLKDDDYRLSFLFGNFTTLTRFTEADLERVTEQRLSPLHVSVHSTDPRRRTAMLRNDRGGMSLRWMRELLANGISVKAQIVLCPGVNDGAVLDDTLASVLEAYTDVEAVAIVPLGLSRFNPEAHLRTLTRDEAEGLIVQVETWQERFLSTLGRQPLFLSDEVYLTAGVPVPDAAHYGSYSMIEDGIGIVRSFLESFSLSGPEVPGRHDGFFSEFDALNPTDYTRAPNPAADTALRRVSSINKQNVDDLGSGARTVVLTGSYAAPILSRAIEDGGFRDIEVREVTNNFFGGNTAVAGLLTFADLSASITASGDANALYVIPDVCLNEGRFLDGPSIDDLAALARVKVIETSGTALRSFLESLVPA